MANRRPSVGFSPSKTLGVTAALLALGVMLGACGGARRSAAPAAPSPSAAASSAPSGVPAATSSSAAAPGPAAVPGSPAATSPAGTGPAAPAAPGASMIQALGITAVQMATAVAPDGSASGPKTTFDASRDRKIVAVLTLANLPAGTTISYVRYLGDKYVNAKSASLVKASKSFSFEFTALPGKNFTPGHYRIRFYVNQHPAMEAGYDVR